MFSVLNPCLLWQNQWLISPTVLNNNKFLIEEQVVKKEDDMSSIYSIGLLNQLADALENANFSAGDVTKLKQFGNLKGIKDVLYGSAEIIEHLINCDADPYLPNGWSVEEHQKGGQFSFNPTKVELYLSKKSIVGNDLRKEIKSKKVLNANVLDYLLDQPELIPDDWKEKHVFFFGTIYRDSGDNLYVRCLHWHGSRWLWNYYWLISSFHSDDPVAVAS